METYSKLSPEDISLEKTVDSKEVFLKESEKSEISSARQALLNLAEKLGARESDATEIINNGLNIMKESIILQTLEQRGVKGISHIKRNENDLPYSQSGFIKKNVVSRGYVFSSIGIEKVPGVTWSEHEFSGQEEIVEAVLKAAKIFKDIYDAGFVHNDIKPTNLMIDNEGNVTVIDFNAAEPHDKAGISYSKAITTLYAAPERVELAFTNERGEGQYHVSGDIYSLTATLAEKIGLNINVLKDENIASELQRRRFHEEIQKKVLDSVMSEKLAILIMWDMSTIKLARDSNFDDFIESLKMVEDPKVKPEELFNHFTSASKRKEEKD